MVDVLGALSNAIALLALKKSVLRSIRAIRVPCVRYAKKSELTFFSKTLYASGFESPASHQE
jgi:hypothetical protein